METPLRSIRSKFGDSVGQLSLKRQETISGWAFVLPKCLLILFVIGFPIVYGTYVAFTDSDLFTIPGEFIGLDNFFWLAGYDVWWISIRNVLILGLILIPTNIFFAFTTAMLLMEKVRGNYFYRIAFLIPVAGPPLVWAIVWRLLIFPTEGGIANALFIAGGIIDSAIPFTTSTRLALPSVILSVIWGFGISMLIYMAAMSGVPRSVIHAAKIDGAGRIARIRYLLWPLMKPTTFFLVVIQMVLIFQMGFAAVFVLTGGGPNNATMVPSYFIYTLAFQFHEFGRSAAAAIVLFLLTALITLALYKPLQSRTEYYQ